MGDKTPRFTKPHGAYQYARIRAVANYCKENYDNLTTVWLSLSAAEKQSGKWVHPLEHDDGFRSHAVKQALYRARLNLGIDRWAGLWLMAPRKTGYSHRHYALWIDTESVSEKDYHPVIDSHVRNHPIATESGNLYGDAIQIRKGCECGSFLAEIARNLPEIGPGEEIPSPDVRSIEGKWRYVQAWCSLYWYMDRIRSYELGSFGEIAESLKPDRDGEWVYGKGWL